jgi:hypothetical protein
VLRIHSSLNNIEIHNCKNALESNGIQCEVRGEFRRSLMLELPITESFVELWLLNDDQEDAARQILSGALPTSSRSWTCPQCGEAIDAGFDQCWNCQTSQPK